MDYTIVLQILGSLIGIFAAMTSTFRIIRVSQAENRLREVVQNQNPEVIDIGHSLEQSSGNDADQQELQKARVIIEQSLPLLETDDRKEILTRLNQPSEQGRINYMLKILGDSYVFQSSLLLFLLRNFVILILGTYGLYLYIETRDIIWLAICGIFLVISTILVIRYNASKIVIQKDKLSFQRGLLTVDSIVIPLWNANLEVRQSLLGRLLNYGTVRFYVDDQLVEMRNVQDAHQLRTIITKQKQFLQDMTKTNQSFTGSTDTPLTNS